MSILSQLKSDVTIKEDKDTLGGGQKILDSGIYKDALIELAYITASTNGALALNVSFKINEMSYKFVFYMTSSIDKGCKNFYINKAGDKKYLPGYLHANHLCLLTTKKEISSLSTEEKVISLYDFAAKANVPTKVNMVPDLLGKTVTLGIIKQVVDKNTKTDDGRWVATGETREENQVDRLFRSSDGRTVNEIKDNINPGVFLQQWADKWTGVTKTKTSGTTAPVTAAAPSTITKSLFEE